MQKSTFLTPRNENSSNIVFEKATVVCENAYDEKIAANYPSGMVYHKSSKSKKCIEEIWKVWLAIVLAMSSDKHNQTAQ